MNIQIDEREHATILAGLRLLQVLPGTKWSAGILDIATCAGELSAMEADEIDGLCERINTQTDAPFTYEDGFADGVNDGAGDLVEASKTLWEALPAVTPDDPLFPLYGAFSAALKTAMTAP